MNYIEKKLLEDCKNELCDDHTVYNIGRYCSASSNISYFDEDGNTALHLICKRESREFKLEIVRILIRNGANVNAENFNKKTPLHLLCEKSKHFEDSISIVNILIRNGCDINALDNNGKSPIKIAYDSGTFIWFLTFLIQCGANIDTFDKMYNSNIDFSLLKKIVDSRPDQEQEVVWRN